MIRINSLLQAMTAALFICGSSVSFADDPGDLFATAVLTSCSFSGKATVTATGIVQYSLGGECGWSLGSTAYNTPVHVTASWDGHTAHETFQLDPEDNGTTVTSAVKCNDNPWTQGVGVCDQTYLGVVTVLSGVSLPPYPLSASTLSDADRQQLKIKTAAAEKHPLPPDACKEFINTGEFICATDDSFNQCKVQQSEGLIKTCDKKAHNAADLATLGCHNLYGFISCPHVTGYIQCRNLALAKIITAVCIWSDHPDWSLGDACCQRMGESANWKCPNPLAMAVCNLAKGKKTASSCKLDSSLPSKCSLQ
jgi:hypothetical protein